MTRRSIFRLLAATPVAKLFLKTPEPKSEFPPCVVCGAEMRTESWTEEGAFGPSQVTGYSCPTPDCIQNGPQQALRRLYESRFPIRRVSKIDIDKVDPDRLCAGAPIAITEEEEEWSKTCSTKNTTTTA